MLAFVCLPANSQAPESETNLYAKDGLAFEYPVSWILTDKTTAETQHLIISREGSSALIMIVALRALARESRQLDAAHKGFTQPLIENMSEKFGDGSSPRRASCVDVSGKKAYGVRLKGTYEKLPSTGEVYSFMMGLRFVNLVFVRADKDEAQGNIAWKVLREVSGLISQRMLEGRQSWVPKIFPALEY